MAESIGSLRADFSADSIQWEKDLAKIRLVLGKTVADLSKKLDKFGKRTEKLGKSFTRNLTLPIAAVATGSVVMAAKFEKSMSKIVGLVGVSQKQVKAWEKDIKRIGPETGKSLDELGEGLFFITSAGLRGSKAIEVLEASAKASAAGLGEVGKIADLVTSAVNAYGSENLSASKATDILVAAVREGKAEAPEFAEALGRVLPLASQMEITFDQVAGAVAAMTKTGSNAAEATTQLRSIMTGIIKPSKQAEQALNDMGTSSEELRRKIKEQGLFAALKDLRDLTRKYGEEVVAKVFPNIRALAGVLDLTGASAAENAKVMEAVANSTGLTDKAFKEAMKTADALWRQFKAQLNVALVVLGQHILPIVVEQGKKLLSFLKTLTERFSQLSPQGKQIVVVLGAIAAAIGPVLIGLGALFKLLSGSLAVIAGVASAKILLIVGALGLLAVAITKVITNWDNLKKPTGDFVSIANKNAQATSNLEQRITALKNQLDPTASAWVKAGTAVKDATDKFDPAAKEKTNNLAQAMGFLKNETNNAATAWSEAKGPLDNFFGSLITHLQNLTAQKPGSTDLGVFGPAVSKDIEKAKLAREELQKLNAQQFMAGVQAGIAKAKFKQFSEGLFSFKKVVKESKEEVEDLGRGGGGLSGAKDKADALKDEIKNLGRELQKLGKSDKELLELEAQFKILDGQAEDLVEKWKKAKLELEKQTKAISAIEELEKVLEDLQDELSTIGATLPELRELRLIAIEAQIPWDILNESQLKKTKELLEQIRQAALDVDLKKTAEAGRDALQSLEEEFGLLPEKAKDGLTALDVFASDIASNINTAFANTLESLVFDIKNLGDVWKNVLRGMLNSFFQLISTIATNPIRIALSGEGPGGINIGNVIGSLFGGIGESFRSLGSLILGEFAGITGFIGTLGAALPAIGLIAGAVAGIVSLIKKLFEKKPKLDIDFDRIKIFSEETGETIKRAASVGELIDEELQDAIFNIDKRKAGVKKDEIFDTIQGILRAQVEQIQDILGKLPEDLSALLNKALLNTVVDIETEVGGDRLLEFDDTGKSIKKQLEAFLGGELQARFLFAIRSFFTDTFEQLGALPEAAAGVIDELFEEFTSIRGSGAKAREARAAIGQELLETFNAMVDAFNFAAGRFGDSASEAIGSLKSLAEDLGFEGIATIKEMQASMQDLIANAEVDPETIEKMKALKQGIEDLGLGLAATNIALIQFIDSLNAKIVQLGGTAEDTSGALDDTIDSLVGLIQGGTLSFQGKLSALQQLEQAVGLQIQKELQAAQAAVDAQNTAIQAQNQAIQEQIQQTQEQIRLVREKGNEEIRALEEVLSVLQRFKDLAEQLKNDLRNLFTGTNSILTPFEKLNFIQGEVAAAAQKLAQAVTQEEKLNAIEQLRGLQGQLIDLGSGAFGTASPEFQAIFRQVADELQSLVDTAEAEGEKVETVQNKIDSLKDSIEREVQQLEASIQASQGQIQDLLSTDVQLSGETANRLREILEFAREEAKKLLEESNAALQELGVDTSLLNPIEAINAEQLIVLRDIRDNLGGIIPAAKGFHATVSSQQLILVGEKGTERVDVTPQDQFAKMPHLALDFRRQVPELNKQQNPSRFDMKRVLDAVDFRNLNDPRNERVKEQIDFNMDFDIDLSGDSTDTTKRFFAREIVNVFKEFLRDGEGREIIREITRS